MTTGIWEFSVAFYARPRAAEACLALQERGFHVTTLLAALWAAASGRPALLPEDYERIEARVGIVQRDAIVPLRGARVALKPLGADPAIAALRERIKRLERDAERLALESIAATLPVPTSAPGSARDNLMAHPKGAALLADPAARALLDELQDWMKTQAK